MKTIAIEKRDVYVTLEFSIQEIRFLAFLLRQARIQINDADAFEKAAGFWCEKALQPDLNKFTEAFGERDGDS